MVYGTTGIAGLAILIGASLFSPAFPRLRRRGDRGRAPPRYLGGVLGAFFPGWW
jgi:hypothetical protein